MIPRPRLRAAAGLGSIGQVRIFLSYAHEDRPTAEEIAVALQAEGHEVFFDRSMLEGGGNYNREIRRGISRCDRFLFLISPHSIAPGRYCLTELRMVEGHWPSPVDRVLPVLISPTETGAIPAYLRGVTFFEPVGNPAAEIAAKLAEEGEKPGSGHGKAEGHPAWTPRAVQQIIIVTTGCLCLVIVILVSMVLVAIGTIPAESLGPLKFFSVAILILVLGAFSITTVRLGLAPGKERA